MTFLAADGKEGIDPAHPGELWQMEKTDDCCRNICHALLICLLHLSSRVSMQNRKIETLACLGDSEGRICDS